MYTFLNPEIKTPQLPPGGNNVNFSIYDNLYKPISFRGLSIKYVVQGLESYTINDKNYHVNAGEFLLANATNKGEVCIESHQTKGVCIDISFDILAQVIAYLVRPGELSSTISLYDFFHTKEFLENKYASTDSSLGATLMALGNKLATNPNRDYSFDEEFYFHIAEKLVHQHKDIIRGFYKIPVIKQDTRKELYRKLYKAKGFLENHFAEKITINLVAENAGMSEYHFYRLFKKTFTISPHQFLINKRIEKSMEILKNSKHSITDVAVLTGFTDVHNFSKSFKKTNGISPVVFRSSGK